MNIYEYIVLISPYESENNGKFLPVYNLHICLIL